MSGSLVSAAIFNLICAKILNTKTDLRCQTTNHFRHVAHGQSPSPSTGQNMYVHACACACACVCVSCVLHLTTFEFKLYKIYDAKHFHTTENWGFLYFFFPWLLLVLGFSGCPFGVHRRFGCCSCHKLPLIEAQSNKTSNANIVCAIVWHAFNSIGQQKQQTGSIINFQISCNNNFH